MEDRGQSQQTWCFTLKIELYYFLHLAAPREKNNKWCVLSGKGKGGGGGIHLVHIQALQ